MNFIDFFSGIGGFRLGMEMASHECVGHCEIDKFANKSYIAMHSPEESEWYADDIRRVSPGDLPEAEVYCFGFPCQAFSIAGKRRGFEDTRGTLFFEVMRLAKVRKPDILFAENVKGLLSHEGGRTFGTIIRTMDELGYDVEWQVCNSKNFGVPQNRERVFIIGHLRGSGSRKIFPFRNNSKEASWLQGQNTGTITTRTGEGTTVGTYVVENKQHAQVRRIEAAGIYTNASDEFMSPPMPNVSRTLKANSHDTGVIYPVSSVEFLNKKQNGRRTKGNEEPMFTLTAKDRHGVFEREKQKIRKLTPKECFRLQGFPDEYFERAAAVNSDSQLYKQAGNSVTVNMIYEIARRLEMNLGGQTWS